MRLLRGGACITHGTNSFIKVALTAKMCATQQNKRCRVKVVLVRGLLNLIIGTHVKTLKSYYTQ